MTVNFTLGFLRPCRCHLFPPPCPRHLARGELRAGTLLWGLLWLQAQVPMVLRAQAAGRGVGGGAAGLHQVRACGGGWVGKPRGLQGGVREPPLLPCGPRGRPVGSPGRVPTLLDWKAAGPLCSLPCLSFLSRSLMSVSPASLGAG